MKRNYLLLLLLMVLCGCSENELSVPEKEGDSPRIIFSNTEEFMNECMSLLQKDYNEQTDWADAKIPNSLLKHLEQCKDEKMLALPRAYQAMFNDKMEVQVADSIFKFADGGLYLTALGESMLQEPVLCGELTSFPISKDVDQDALPQTRATNFELRFGKISVPSHQLVFKIESKTKYSFNYVHEFVATKGVINGYTAHTLVLMLKLEYRGSGSWKGASEKRNIDINLNIGCSVNFPVEVYRANVNGSLRGVQYNQQGLVAWIIERNGMNTGIWTVNVSGTIKHSLVDFPGKEWNDTW